jgi:hypothetical protein
MPTPAARPAPLYFPAERRWISRPLAALSALLAAGCALCCLALQMWPGAIFGAILTALLAACAREWPRIGVMATPPLAAIGVFATIPDWLRIQDDLVASARAGSWGLHEQAAVAWINLLMALAGLLCGFPEAAVETALLATPPTFLADAAPAGEEGKTEQGTAQVGERTFAYDFPMRSAAVRAAVEADIQTALKAGRPVPLPERHCTWSGNSSEMRAYAALDPLMLRGMVSGMVSGEAPTLQISYRATVQVTYPESARPIRFLGIIDERLFAALARDGWHHSYAATYIWSLDAALPLAVPVDIPWIDDAIGAWNAARHGGKPGICRPA